MGVLNREAGEITAKIVYFGPSGAGTTTNLQRIYRKLKREHRGELKRNSIDGKAGYEFLPVQLGAVRGFSTTIHIYTVPGGPKHAAKRRQILDGTDGIVFVADLRPSQHEATLAAAKELTDHLAAYGRGFDDVLLAVQYNHRDQADENALDALHRKIPLKPLAHFEAVAPQGTGVLQTLTTLSKQILGNLRKQADSPEPEAAPAPVAEPMAEPVAEPEVVEVEMEAEAEAVIEPEAPVVSAALDLGEVDPAEKGFAIASAGPVDAMGSEIRIPICLVDESTGRKIELCLRLNLAPA